MSVQAYSLFGPAGPPLPGLEISVVHYIGSLAGVHLADQPDTI